MAKMTEEKKRELKLLEGKAVNFSISLTKHQMEFVDYLIAHGYYGSRSALFQNLLMNFYRDCAVDVAPFQLIQKWYEKAKAAVYQTVHREGRS